MNKFSFLSLLFLLPFTTYSQTDTYWVFFTDKGGHAMELDQPVSSEYIEQVQQFGELKGSSKWFNAAVIAPNSSRSLANLSKFAFVKGYQKLRPLKVNKNEDGEPMDLGKVTNPSGLDYGRASFQNNMINIAALHQKGFSGKGVRIAVFDAGFSGADTISAFDSLWLEDRILAYYDFVDGEAELFSESSHGTKVLSTIAANLPGKMVGTAPDASFILCRTEDGASETRQEEYNWVRAMEWADSIGVDVIHSSLGYSTFDSESESYSYDQLDGNQTIISRAADIAASKGIIVTTSAGNEGSGSWKYITAPCDADSVLCIGAVDRTKKRSRFSSYGPSADDQVKPDVVAMGTSTIVVDQRGRVVSGNGTSFSSPIIAGLVACLVQSHPDRNNMDIIQAVRMSGSTYNNPDDSFGYGIPDAAFADSLLRSGLELEEIEVETVAQVEPVMEEKEAEKVIMTENPKTTITLRGNQLFIRAPDEIFKVQLMYGKQKVTLDPADVEQIGNEVIINAQYLISGDYYIKIETEAYDENVAFSK